MAAVFLKAANLRFLFAKYEFDVIIVPPPFFL